MGSALTEERKLFAALNNCAFTSTDSLKEDCTRPFTFMMDASMLGVGVGFDTKGAGTITIKGPNLAREQSTFNISDDREGWVESLKLLLESYFLGLGPISFDYSSIRVAGLPIKGFGGKSSGPAPLIKMHENIRKVLEREIGQPISVTAITDIMNLIGVCVVAGNVRRTAEIVFGDPKSDEYVDLKNPKVNKERNDDKTGWGWTSNNSVFAEIGMNYNKTAARTALNGDPGYAWLSNMREYSRMCDPIDNKDHRAKGGNPCLEQTLESGELCCLVETFIAKHDSLEDYLKTLKYAYLYAKTVTLGKTHWPETNKIMLRNRRIGCSISGIQQFVANKGLNTLKTWLEDGYSKICYYDDLYSDWMAIPKSIKKTSIKPSGTVSKLVGSTPGIHWPNAIYCIKNMRIARNSDLLPIIEKAGYHVEPAVNEPETTMVVSIPYCVGENLRSVDKVSIWEQVSMAAFMQKYWADNQVSCTVEFDPKTESDQIEHTLNYFQYQLKGISYLPRFKAGVYPQMPEVPITKDEYESLIRGIKPMDFSDIKNEQADQEVFCDTEKCELLATKKPK
jgi:hypothetical protein